MGLGTDHKNIIAPVSPHVTLTWWHTSLHKHDSQIRCTVLLQVNKRWKRSIYFQICKSLFPNIYENKRHLLHSGYVYPIAVMIKYSLLGEPYSPAKAFGGSLLLPVSFQVRQTIMLPPVIPRVHDLWCCPGPQAHRLILDSLNWQCSKDTTRAW